MVNTSFLDREMPYDVLKEFARLSVSEIDRLNQKIAQLTKDRYDFEQARLAYEDKLTKLKEKLFGSGTEKTGQGVKDP